jgi:hypothetical protein
MERVWARNVWPRSCGNCRSHVQKGILLELKVAETAEPWSKRRRLKAAGNKEPTCNIKKASWLNLKSGRVWTNLQHQKGVVVELKVAETLDPADFTSKSVLGEGKCCRKSRSLAFSEVTERV